MTIFMIYNEFPDGFCVNVNASLFQKLLHSGFAVCPVEVKHFLLFLGIKIGHAANTLLKHPDAVKVGWAMSGVYDMRRFMDGMSDDNFYFNNPVDYIGGMNDWGQIAAVNSCELHLVTGTGPWERPGDTYHFSQLLTSKGIRHSLDDWGPKGGHDWPFWKGQMREYLGRL